LVLRKSALHPDFRKALNHRIRYRLGLVFSHQSRIAGRLSDKVWQRIAM
jgi:hypothetical protein